MNSPDENPDSGPVILYVDDEPLARKYFVRSFGAEHQVSTAAGADEAISLLGEPDSRIGIVVTDYRMPGHDGGHLLRRIERDFPQLVRILVTAYADRDLLLDAVNSGEVFRILEKPLDPDEVGNVLRQASKLARERDFRRQTLGAIDETLAFLAHELNTPLAAIGNFASGVQSRVAGEAVSARQQAEIGKAAQAISDNTRYCLALLASFAESVREGVPSRRFGGTAKQLISQLLDAYPLSSAQRAAISVELRQDFLIAALPNCVALVLSSILANALRAVGELAAPAIRLTALIDDHPKIRVADNGPGIPPRVLERLLFDPVTTHAAAGSKGWGLILCQRIMRSFKGDIMIESHPGIHTTVTLIFPATNRRTEP